MNEACMKTRITQAVEAQCAMLQPNPYLAQRVLETAAEGRCQRRHFSWGLALAVVLMLAAVSAVAAVSLRGLYEKAIEQESPDGLVVGWSAEEKISFVNRMVEAGIALDADKVSQLRRDDLTLWAKDAIALQLLWDYYPARDGSLTTADIMAKELGSAEAWSVADKAWYAEEQARFHPERHPGSRYLLPAADDLPEETALEIFKQNLQAQYRIAEADMDLSTLSTSFGEYVFDTGDGASTMRCWYFCVQLQDGNEAMAYISAEEGSVVDLSITAYIE